MDQETTVFTSIQQLKEAIFSDEIIFSYDTDKSGRQNVINVGLYLRACGIFEVTIDSPKSENWVWVDTFKSGPIGNNLYIQFNFFVGEPTLDGDEWYMGVIKHDPDAYEDIWNHESGVSSKIKFSNPNLLGNQQAEVETNFRLDFYAKNIGFALQQTETVDAEYKGVIAKISNSLKSASSYIVNGYRVEFVPVFDINGESVEGEEIKELTIDQTAKETGLKLSKLWAKMKRLVKEKSSSLKVLKVLDCREYGIKEDITDYVL